MSVELHLENLIQHNREKQVYNVLVQMGFRFASREELEAFSEQRITQVTFEDKPGVTEVYLDFDTPAQRFIASWDDQWLNQSVEFLKEQ